MQTKKQRHFWKNSKSGSLPPPPLAEKFKAGEAPEINLMWLESGYMISTNDPFLCVCDEERKLINFKTAEEAFGLVEKISGKKLLLLAVKLH